MYSLLFITYVSELFIIISSFIRLLRIKQKIETDLSAKLAYGLRSLGVVHARSEVNNINYGETRLKALKSARFSYTNDYEIKELFDEERGFNQLIR